MVEGVATAHTCAHSTSNALLSHPSSCGSVRSHLAGDVRPSEFLALRMKDLVQPLAPLLP